MARMTKREKKERALVRALELFAPIIKYAKADYDEGGPRLYLTKTDIKRICHWRLPGDRNFAILRNMLEHKVEPHLIYLPTGNARCYTFSTGPEDDLQSILASFEVGIGVQTRTSYLTLWRAHLLGPEELERLAARFGKEATRVQNRLRFLAAAQRELLEEGDEGE